MSKACAPETLEVEGVVNSLLLILSQGEIAYALIVLFCYHKFYIDFWARLKVSLLGRASSHKDFSLFNSLINASTKYSLSESCVEAPGLFSIVISGNQFMESLKREKQIQTDEATPETEEKLNIIESYWTCYCKDNPRDPCCKIYEI